jgi:hypothetical protein
MLRRWAVFAACSSLFLAGPAAAGGGLEARYMASFTGIPIGQGALVAEVNDDGYSVSGSAMIVGMLKMVTPGKGSAAARGQLANGKVLPVSYSGSSESKDRTQEVRLAGAAGTINQIDISPWRRPTRDRVPVTEEHRVGVVDPMSAALMPVPGNADLAGPDACNRVLPIFDGQERYDLIFTYIRTEPVKDVKGYSGPTAVCRVEYRPIAGHREGRKQVKELQENKDIYAWLAPIVGTRVVVPLRVSFGSPIGTFLVQATHFLTEAKPNTSATPSR